MSELSTRQTAAIELIEASAKVIHDLVHGSADTVVITESGQSPTVLALSKMITDLAGGVLLPRCKVIASASTALALNVAYTAGVSFFDITLDKPQCLLSLQSVAVPAGYTWSFTLRLQQGTGANLVTFADDIRWPGKRPPVLAYEAGAADLITFLWDGSHWLGFPEGSWF